MHDWCYFDKQPSQGQEMDTSEAAERRARVFISCGQAKGTDEERIATEIARRLHELGFNPYIAIQEQTLRGLKENIFS